MAVNAEQNPGRIGQPVRRIDAVEKVTGRALYPGDLNRPGQVYMKVLFAGRPHAHILHLDTSAAIQMDYPQAAMAAGAPILHARSPGNVLVEHKLNGTACLG